VASLVLVFAIRSCWLTAFSLGRRLQAVRFCTVGGGREFRSDAICRAPVPNDHRTRPRRSKARGHEVPGRATGSPTTYSCVLFFSGSMARTPGRSISGEDVRKSVRFEVFFVFNFRIGTFFTKKKFRYIVDVDVYICWRF